MLRRFLIHTLNHTVLIVDITAIGIPRGGYPPEGEVQEVSSRRFQTWDDAQRYLTTLGAKNGLLDKTKSNLDRFSVDVFTIPG